jgi:hypothetical protein
MENHPILGPLLSDPKRLLLDMAQQHSVAELLHLIVARFSDSSRVALARIWLAQPTADCSGCPMIEVCRAQSKCLELVASGGRSQRTLLSNGPTSMGRFGGFRLAPERLARSR